jgi:hypothetical protein
MLSGDFDGDGAPDVVSLEPGIRPDSWQIVARLAAKPGETFKLVEGFGVEPEPMEIAPPGSYAIREFGVTSSRTFAYDVILSLRRPDMRSVKYWNGRSFVGTWVVD